MSDIMRLIPFNEMMEWMLSEYKEQGSVFGIRKDKFYKNQSGTSIEMFGDSLSSPLGPAAGPNSQLAQNIVASYLSGCRFIELKTVQIMDGKELRDCVAKPCIKAEDECYNVEWSTELYVEEAFTEYVKAWFALYVLGKEWGLSDKRDFAFNMSVGYDLEGIKSPKIDKFIEGMKDASDSAIFNECKQYLLDNIDQFKNVTKEDVESIETCVCSSITLSTLHGCPPDEIERIARYLLSEKHVHTYIKCNPTLLGYPFARGLMDEMGYSYIAFDDHHFNNDLQWADGVKMFAGLIDYAKELGLGFGVKLTNTFPVQVTREELPGEEMYMSGRSLFPLTVSLADKLTQHFDGKLPIAYSGGADAFNVVDLISKGIQPITVATTILKPGGYERVNQMAKEVEGYLKGGFKGIDKEALHKLAMDMVNIKKHRKEARLVGSRKTSSLLPLFDCAKAPCKDGGCPIEQQIPEYLSLVAAEKYDEAYKVIVKDNASPGITGTICDHQCQNKCTRLDYDEPLAIRAMKKVAVDHAADAYLGSATAAAVKADKKVAVMGAGPAGLAAALYLRRNGVEVDVYEKQEGPYGIVNYVIPEFRISQDTIKKDFALGQKAGVNYNFGVEAKLSDLKDSYDYVVVATGAWEAGRSPVKEGSDQVKDALDFLYESKANDCKVELGKKVVVVGGGDVAMDCARAAKMAPTVDNVTIVYRRTKDLMPAQPEEISLALGDGVDVVELLAPVSYDGKILKCEVMTLGERDASGRPGIKGTGEIVAVEADTVIGATGARVDVDGFKGMGLAIGDYGYVAVNASNETSLEGVYIAGDCKKGPQTIVKAMADSKAIAKDILAKCGLSDDFAPYPYHADEKALYERKGVLENRLPGNEDGLRCLGCDTICELCCDVCPNRANVMIKGVQGVEMAHQIVHLDGMCNECGNCGVFCPHTGNPYKDKVTLFWTEEDFVDSTNKGFLKVEGNTYKVRKEDGQVVTYTMGDGSISTEMASVLDVLVKDYPYYLVTL